MNDDLIARARALAAAATPGPWEAKYDGVVPVPYVDHAVVRTMEDAVGEADAEFIAAARTLVPELCDAIEQAEQERDQARESVSLLAPYMAAQAAAEARVATLEAALDRIAHHPITQSSDAVTLRQIARDALDAALGEQDTAPKRCPTCQTDRRDRVAWPCSERQLEGSGDPWHSAGGEGVGHEDV